MLPTSPFKLFQWEDRPLSWMKTCQVLGFSCSLSCDRQSKPSEVTKHISLPKLKEFWSEILINTSNFIHIETSSPRPQLRQSWHLSGQCLPISGRLLPTWAEVRAVGGGRTVLWWGWLQALWACYAVEAETFFPVSFIPTAGHQHPSAASPMPALGSPTVHPTHTELLPTTLVMQTEPTGSAPRWLGSSSLAH